MLVTVVTLAIVMVTKVTTSMFQQVKYVGCMLRVKPPNSATNRRYGKFDNINNSLELCTINVSALIKTF